MEAAELLRVILVGLSVHARPRGEGACERPTVPLNLFRLVAVSVDVPVAPALTATTVGVTLVEKSWTLKVTETVWESPVVETVASTE